MADRAPRVTVFGLGEAGALIAADLAAAGAEVAGYDPASVPTPVGVRRHDDPGAAVAEPDLVLAVTPAVDAATALEQALDSIGAGTTYADLATSSPEKKQQLAVTADSRGIVFADVALMATVPGKGVRTPSFVSGPGATRYVELIEPLGGVVTSIGEEPGLAATRKLLRSVVMKGLAALTIEAMTAAERTGQAEWFWGHLADQIGAADETLLKRLVVGTATHADRRQHEMEAAAELVARLGVDPLMTEATVASLEQVRGAGLPDLDPWK